VEYDTPEPNRSPDSGATGPAPSNSSWPTQPANQYPGNQGPRPAQGYPGNQRAYPGSPPPPPPAPAYGNAGYPPPGYGPYPYRPMKPFSGKAIASAVIGGAMLLFFPLGIIGNIVGGILGFSALKDTREDGGTHRGRGLAIGGIIGNAVVWLLSAGIVALIVFAISMGVKEQKRYQEQRRTDYAADQKADVDADLTTIAERLGLYYISNDHSLKPGGPIVNDGGTGGLYTEDSPKVEGALKINHLVRDIDLNQTTYSYKLTITGDTSAEIEYLSKHRILVVDDVATQSWHFKGP